MSDRRGDASQIALEAHAEGTIVPVKAQAGARRSGLRGLKAGRLQVAVTAAPEKGKANRAIIALLAEALGVRKSQIELVGGAMSQHKRFLVRGLAADELASRIGHAHEA